MQFATFLAFFMCSTGLTGLILILAGWLRLSFVVRYLPYPIIGGVIVSIGYLLIISSVSLVLERTVDIYSLPAALADSSLSSWVPWALAAAALFVAGRRLPAKSILPIGIIIAFAAFHAFLRATGTSLDEAAASGLLLGPFPDGGFLDGLSPGLLLRAEWGVVLSHMTVLLAIAPVSALTCLIHVQAICRVTGEEPDLDRDLVANGLANVAGAGTGNIVSFPAISTSVLASEFGTRTLGVCTATAALSVLVAVYGADLLGALPRGLLAMLILYLGLNMLIPTLVTEWRRLPARDFAPTLAILATTITTGLFYGLTVGVGLSVFLFVVFSARLPFIRAETTLARRRSIVERGEPQRTIIEKAGERVRILEISGYLFFGTAHALLQRIRELTRAEGPPTEIIVLDFHSVTDIYASALFSLARTREECRKRGVEIHFCDLPDFVARRLCRFGFAEADTGHATLDDALEVIEENILADASDGSAPGNARSFLQEFAAAVPDLDLADVFVTISLSDGASVVEEGDPTTDMFVLLEGRAAAVVGAETQERHVVARFGPGTLVAEMAFYQDAPRNATVVAEGHARLMRIEGRQLTSPGQIPETLLVAFHKIAARYLSQLLDRTTKLLLDARI